MLLYLFLRNAPTFSVRTRCFFLFSCIVVVLLQVVGVSVDMGEGENLKEKSASFQSEVVRGVVHQPKEMGNDETKGTLFAV